MRDPDPCRCTRLCAAPLLNAPQSSYRSRAGRLTRCSGDRSCGLTFRSLCLIATLISLIALAAPPAAAQTFVSCQNDVQGANDQPGQKDLTRFCVEPGTSPFEVFTQWNWDLVTLAGGNTGDACALFDTNSDGNVNLAVCVTIRDHGAFATLGAVRLFTCIDTRPDRCTGSTQITGNRCVGGTNPNALCSSESDCSGGGTCMPGPGKNTTCSVSQQNTDPFPPDDAYPSDTVATCSVDLADFGGGTSARLIDACSYPSEIPNSDPSDCILFQGCTDASQCSDGNPCTMDTCDTQQGFCRHTPLTGNSCNDGNACNTNDTCNSFGFCEGNTPVNCDDNNVCTTDGCNPATGCTHVINTNSCDDGNACTTGDTCSGGACVGGAPPNCNDGNPCTDDSCNPASGCVNTPNTAPCNDGNACTTGDVCSGGSCQPGGPTNCDDGNVCTTDGCNPASGCTHSNNTNPCSDGNACTTGDTCSGGTCQPGTAVVCNDNNVCTTDTCNPATGCVFTNNTNSCDDGNACTTSDTCSGGACVGGPAPNCNDGNVCTTDTCNTLTGCVHTNNTNPCDDGNACTTSDTCSGGACVGGPAPNCNDGNVCTTDTCNTLTGCVHTNNTNPCDDGNACTTNDTCSGGSCVGGPAPNCDDGNVCTTDGCNPASGCTHVNNTNPCSDGNACTTNDTCSGGSCVGGPAPNCDDGNVCTTDSCDPATGCVHINNAAPCSDGNACTTGDTCAAGACVGGSLPLDCNDNNVCTDDSCNPSTGCVHTNNSNPCNDGDACTSNDTCSGGVCTGTPTAVKYTGGGQFIATNINSDKWSFGFNFRGTTTGPTNGEFNGLDHVSGLHINGPVIGIVPPCGNTGDCPNSTNSITFLVRDKKTGCIYRVTVEDNTEPGANSDRIRVQRLPSDQDPGAPSSCTTGTLDTGCQYLSAGNIQKHPTN